MIQNFLDGLAAQFLTIDGVPNILAAAIFIAAVRFVIVYGTHSQWWTNSPGRGLMAWVVSFAGLVLMNTIHLATGRYEFIWVTRFFVYGALLTSVILLNRALDRVLKDGGQITTATFVQPRKKSKEKP